MYLDYKPFEKILKEANIYLVHLLKSGTYYLTSIFLLI